SRPFLFSAIPRPPISTLYPYTTLFRSTIASVSDIPPGKNYATLTLGNGTVIPLDQTSEGEIVRQSGLVIRKTADARLVYETAARSEEHTSELQSRENLVCRLLLEKKKN